MKTSYWMDAKRLHILHVVYERDSNGTHQRLRKRLALHRAIAQRAEDGKICIVESGMDCDCVKYDNRVHTVEATWQAVVDYIDDMHDWADGPFSYYFERPSVARELKYGSRDLAAEAHENGHPHSIYSGI